MADNSIVISIDAPIAVEGGQPFDAVVTMQNTGTTTWIVGGANPYHLGSQSPQDTTRWGANRISLLGDVPPGGTAVFTFTRTAPLMAGQYAFAWKMLHEYIAWFGATASKTVTVLPVPPTIPQPRSDPMDLVSAMVFNTGPYVADGIEHTITWTNATGRRLLVKSSYIWTGADSGARMDVHAEVRRGDGSYLNIIQWDHYAEPTSPVARDEAYTPYMALEPDEQLTLAYRAMPFSGAPHAHHIFIMWFQYEL